MSHAIGGSVRNLRVGLSAHHTVATYDALAYILKIWFYHHYIQLSYQIANTEVNALSSLFVRTERPPVRALLANKC